MPKSKLLRRVLAILAVLALLLAVGAVIAYVRFDPQSFGPQLAARVEQMTGRKASIGKISLDLFPAPAVSVAPLSVANAAGQEGDTLRIEKVAIRARIWPLLSGRLEVSSVVIDGPVVAVARSSDGAWSFADLLERLKGKPAAPSAAQAPAPRAAPAIAVGVEQAKVRNARIEIVDDAVVPGRRSEIVIAPVDATLSGWGLGRATTIELSAGLGKSRLQSTARLSGSGASQILDLAIPAARLELQDCVRLLPWLGVVQPDGLAVSGAVAIQGKAAMPLDRVETLEFAGTATIDGGSYQDATMKRPIQNLTGKLNIDGDTAHIESFRAVLGDSDVRGTMKVENFLKPRVDLALESDRLDLNQILETFAGGAAASQNGTQARADATGQGLLNLRAKGTLVVRALRFQTFDVADARATLRLEHSELALEGLAATLYGGKVTGSGRVDLSQAVPRETITVTLSGVDVNAAATAYDAGLEDILRGSLSGDLVIEATGLQMEPILDTARGQVRIEILKGTLTSISILKQLAAVLEAAGGHGIGRDETPFDWLRGTFTIAGRKAVTEDLALHSPDLDMTVQGRVGLDTTLDLKCAPSLAPEVTQAMVAKTQALGRLVDPNGRLTVHLNAKGTLAAPSISVDVSAQTKEVRKEAEDKLKQKLRDKLKGILGK